MRPSKGGDSLEPDQTIRIDVPHSEHSARAKRVERIESRVGAGFTGQRTTSGRAQARLLPNENRVAGGCMTRKAHGMSDLMHQGPDPFLCQGFANLIRVIDLGPSDPDLGPDQPAAVGPVGSRAT